MKSTQNTSTTSEEDVISDLYFECHITIEPVFDGKLSHADFLAKKHKFSVADLLMKKREKDTLKRSEMDTFMTGRNKSFNTLKTNMESLIKELLAEGFKVWRYKIEDTILDSKFNDSLELLNK